MPEHLYIGQQDYFSFFNTKPAAPDEEMWVLQPRIGPPISIEGSGKTAEIPKLPALPPLLLNLLKPFTQRIYKFNRTAQLRTHLVLFQHPTFQISMFADIQVVLIDPISYMESSPAHSQNSSFIEDMQQTAFIENALQTALQAALTFDSPKYNGYRVIPLTLDNLVPTKMVQTERLAITAMNAIQNHPDLHNTLGIRARILVCKMDFPAIFDDFVYAASQQLKTELQNVNELLMPQSLQKPSGVEDLEWKEHLYTTIAPYYQEAKDEVEPILTRLLDKISDVPSAGSDPQLAASIFKVLVERLIDGTMHTNPVQSSPKSTEIIIDHGKSLRTTSTRKMEIKALYTMAQDQHWNIVPPMDSVKEVMLIDLTESYQIEMQVPPTYPNPQPVIKITYNYAPVRQSEINSLLQPIISQQHYNLCDIVSRIAQHFATTTEDAQ